MDFTKSHKGYNWIYNFCSLGAPIENKKAMLINQISKISFIGLIIGSVLFINDVKSQEISTIGEIHDFEVGDEFHIAEIGSSPSGPDVHFLNKSILNKYFSDDNDTIYYEIERKGKWLTTPVFGWEYYIDTVIFEVADLNSMLFSGEVDSVYSDPNQFNGRIINYKINNGYYDETWKYVNGCGRAYYRFYQSEGGYSYELVSSLVYFKKGEEEWGIPQYIVTKNFTDPLAQWNVAKTYPHANPQNPSFVETSTRVYGFNGDTIIDNESWLKFYSTPDSNFVYELYYEGCFKEENGIVLFVDSANTIDTIYNFNLTVGDSVLYNFGWGSNYLQIENIDSVEINGQFHKRYIFEEPDYPPFILSEIWIEGIGSIHGPLFPKYPSLFETEIPDSLKLTCYKVQNSVVWNDPDYEDCYVSILLDTEERSVMPFNIFPNPAGDHIYLQTDNNYSGDLEIVSLSGITVKKVKFSSNQKMDISELKPGIYILKMKYQDQTIFKKLIKE